MMNAELGECPPDQLRAVLDLAEQDDAKGLTVLDALMETYPKDARLPFLKGSLLASMRAYEDAQQWFKKAVDVSPGYSLARFQLGFLQLTSGDPVSAQSSWAPLKTLPADAPLRIFVVGLEHLIQDEFEQCLVELRRGVALNSEVVPLNNDMLLIINKCEAALNDQATDNTTDEPGCADGDVSETHLLLRKYRFDTPLN